MALCSTPLPLPAPSHRTTVEPAFAISLPATEEPTIGPPELPVPQPARPATCGASRPARDDGATTDYPSGAQADLDAYSDPAQQRSQPQPIKVLFVDGVLTGVVVGIGRSAFDGVGLEESRPPDTNAGFVPSDLG